MSKLFEYILLCYSATMGSSGTETIFSSGMGMGYSRESAFLFAVLAISGYARARIRVCAHEVKQVLCTLFSGGYECPYEDMESECRWSGRISIWTEEF